MNTLNVLLNENITKDFLKNILCFHNIINSDEITSINYSSSIEYEINEQKYQLSYIEFQYYLKEYMMSTEFCACVSSGNGLLKTSYYCSIASFFHGDMKTFYGETELIAILKALNYILKD